MNTVGLYIKKLRKEKGLTQQELADKLFISFQAVSKWETGETLPETSILLKLCDELDTTVDKLLNGGIIAANNKKHINVENIIVGFNHLSELKHCFGEESIFYKSIIDGINKTMNFDFEKALKINPEVLYTEVIIDYILNGYRINIDEVKHYIKNEKYINEINKRLS